MPKENQFYNLLIFAKGLEEHSWQETTEELDQLRGKNPKNVKKFTSFYNQIVKEKSRIPHGFMAASLFI